MISPDVKVVFPSITPIQNLCLEVVWAGDVCREIGGHISRNGGGGREGTQEKREKGNEAGELHGDG